MYKSSLCLRADFFLANFFSPSLLLFGAFFFFFFFAIFYYDMPPSLPSFVNWRVFRTMTICGVTTSELDRFSRRCSSVSLFERSAARLLARYSATSARAGLTLPLKSSQPV